MEVACRQLGFQGGEWVFWYPHLNDTTQMLYQDPGKTLLFIVNNMGDIPIGNLRMIFYSLIRIRRMSIFFLKTRKHFLAQSQELFK